MMRAGIIVPLLFVPIITAFYVIIIKNYKIYAFELVIVAALLTIAGILISILLNRKYRKDLKTGFKIARTVEIEESEQKKSYEAGSGSMYIGQEMKEIITYYFIIERTRYQVEQELYESCEAGDSIYMFFTPHSNVHIGFGLMG